MSADWINKLNESDSRLHKEGVIKDALSSALVGNQNSIDFLHGMRYCYNKFLTYGIKQIPESSGVKVTQPGAWKDFSDLLDILSRRALTGHDARDAVSATSYKFSSDEWNTFVAPIMRRDIRAGINVSTLNKILKGTVFEIPEFNCQLATNSEDRPEMKGKKRLEPKLDGVRVLMFCYKDDMAVSMSRNGKEFDNFQHVETEVLKDIFKPIMNRYKHLFEGGFILDGEMMGNSFQELMRQARRKTDVAAEDSVFHVFDIIPISAFRAGIWNTKLSDRIAILESIRKEIEGTGSLELLPHIEVDLDTEEGRKALDKYAKEMVALGYEGIMIKDLETPYECDRTTAWLKWKPVYDYDMIIESIEEGDGKHAGRMGAMVGRGVEDGIEFTASVGSGYSDQFRAQIWADYTNKPVKWLKKVKKKWVEMIEYPTGTNHIGRMMVAMSDGITRNRNGTYSLRFPRYKTFRDDKA